MATLAPGEQARMFALGKIARGGATRGGYTSMQPFITIGGVQVGTAPADPTKRILVASLSIHDTLDEWPNTLQMTAHGFAPTPGQAIVITLGSKNSLTRWFGGVVLSTNEGYLVDNPLEPENLVYQVNGIDYHWQLANHLAIRRYTGWTAGAVIRDLVASFAEGFTTTAVDAALEIGLDEITFTNTSVTDAISQVCERIGAYWYADYFQNVHAFFSESLYATPPALTPAHPTLREVSANRDLSQLVTRAIVEGGGGTAATELVPGTTLIPVDTAAWYQAAGGFVVSGPQRITYTGVQTGGAGTLVGPGSGPTAAPAAAPVAGGVLAAGTYQYAYTQVTASGETKPSPVASASSGTVTDPTLAPSVVEAVGSTGSYQPDFPIGSTVQVCIVWNTSSNSLATNAGTANSPVAPAVTVHQNPNVPGYGWAIWVQMAMSADPRVQTVQIYAQCSAFGPTYRLWGAVPNNPNLGPGNVYGWQGYNGTPFNTWPALNGANNTATGQFSISGIAVGQATVTARKLYRTAVNGSQLKLVTTIADNTTTTFADNTPDASLGANVPTSDTSGLQMPAGIVAAGSTTLPVAGAGAFLASGGYAVIGNGEQVVRYTGVSSGNLTGIPAAGPGSITASVAYNSTITAAPMLTGIPASGAGAILYTIKEGDDVNLLVLVDDAGAQSNLAGLIGGSGIKESYIQDRRLGFTEATARGRALLASRNTILLTLAYSVRDPNTRSGRTIHVALPAPFNLTVDLKIQDVTIGQFWPVAGVGPTMKVVASSNFYSLADLLRVARNKVGA